MAAINGAAAATEAATEAAASQRFALQVRYGYEYVARELSQAPHLRRGALHQQPIQTNVHAKLNLYLPWVRYRTKSVKTHHVQGGFRCGRQMPAAAPRNTMRANVRIYKVQLLLY